MKSTEPCETQHTTSQMFVTHERNTSFAFNPEEPHHKGNQRNHNLFGKKVYLCLIYGSYEIII